MGNQYEVDLTVLMPCLNEAETVAKCVEKALRFLGESGIKGEVLVADNGSTDGSIELVQAAGGRVVHVMEKGYGSALQGGIRAAKGQWIIMGDSDDSYDFSAMGGFVDKLKQGFDLVMGCRMPAGGGTVLPGAMPWKHRWIGNPVLTAIGRLFFRCPVHDFHCGLRGFTREAFDRMRLQTTGMEFASEMVIKATLLRMRITEVPITLHPDGRSRPPHLRSWRDGWRHLRFMLLYSPRWLFIWPGLILCALGLAGLTVLSFGSITVRGMRFDTNTMLVSAMTLMVGFQVFFSGVFARLYCARHGLLPPEHRFRVLEKAGTLERGVVAGLLLGIAGIAFLATAVWRWRSLGYGEMSYPDSLRLVIPAITFISLGAQVVFASFLLSVLQLDRFSGRDFDDSKTKPPGRGQTEDVRNA